MRITLLAGFIVTLAAMPAAAQERPFLFSIATAADEKASMRFDYDVGIGEHAFQSDSADQPEQRLGVQVSRGRVTFLARLGIAAAGNSAGRRWQLTATGGPMFHPSDTHRASGAFRDLPPETKGTSYAVKASLSIALVSPP